MIRINQLINAQVHQYLSTSVESCKFGVMESELDTLIAIIRENPHLVRLSGFHTHLGSTIKNLSLYDESVKHLVSVMNLVRQKHGVDSLEFVNFGGGLGIDYEKHAHRTKLTTPILDPVTLKKTETLGTCQESKRNMEGSHSII